MLFYDYTKKNIKMKTTTKTTVKDRAFHALSLNQYNKINIPDDLGEFEIKNIPSEKIYVLRMLIKKPFEDIKIPENLIWITPFIDYENNYQNNILNIKQPFLYLTIRSGIVSSVNDDVWHVDGFSLNITHLPEQNYIWVNNNPTEYIEGKFKIPSDFNYKKHNIHLFFQDNITKNHIIKKFSEKHIYCLDPYIIHKRPFIEKNTNRTFIRLSFTPIEINDINNTKNHLLFTDYKRDGLKDFRDDLIRYK